MLKGPEAVGAVRHRRGERRDRHHDEARPGRRRRVRLQQLASASTQVRAKPDIQNMYGPSARSASQSATVLLYFGAPYPPERTIYDNVGGFFQTGADAEAQPVVHRRRSGQPVNYRVSASSTRQMGVIPNTGLNKINMTGPRTGR